MGEQKDFGNYSWDFKLNGIGSSSSDYGSNDWTDSLLKDMLNGIYYTSEVGDCYKSGENGIPGQCDFTGTGTELSKGLDDTARNMVDKDVIWNLGGYTDGNITTSKFYEKERGTLVNTSIKRNTEWSKETDVGDKHNGIGLMYPSDYGYAVGGSVRSECLSYDIFSYYSYGCVANDWLKPSSDLWTLTPLSSYTNIAFDIGSAGYVYNGYNVYGSFAVWPTLYLKSSVKILPNSKQNQEYGSVDNPFILAN